MREKGRSRGWSSVFQNLGLAPKKGAQMHDDAETTNFSPGSQDEKVWGLPVYSRDNKRDQLNILVAGCSYVSR